jgi:Tfp pilus assembly protein PilX
MTQTRAKLYQDQKGLVSIVVTLVMMLVISLIVVTFAQIIRREQRQVLDRQLNTQAFYAAETGVNQVVKAMQDEGYTSNKTNCDPSGNATIDNSVIDAASGIEITCLLIDNTPATLEYSSIDNKAARTVPIVSSSAFGSITLRWRSASNSSAECSTSSSATFPIAGSWNCPIGVLRVDLVNTSGSLTRDSLNDNVFSAFLYPVASGGTGTATYGSASGPANQGRVIKTNCPGTPPVCTLTINSLSGLNSNSFHMRVRSVYTPSALTIEGRDTSSDRLSFSNAQAVIDSTGKANDVLRRIQVRVCTNRLCALDMPEYVIQSDRICKQYSISDTLSDEGHCGIN